MTKIKAIETEYNGYRFRSRLEARWAVFFDAMDLDYEYEPEGFELPGGQYYLPDFWIPMPLHEKGPNSGFWVEIKPTKPEKIEDNFLCNSLASHGGHSVCMLIGQPYPNTGSICRKFCCHSNESVKFMDFPFDMDITGNDGKPCFMFYICYPVSSGLSGQGKECPGDQFIPAANKARSSRFEHGETP